MARKQYSPSLLLSIFKRKGGEGALTKIVYEQNNLDNLKLAALQGGGEEPIILYEKNDSDWLIFTNRRIIGTVDNTQISFPYSELKDVSLPLEKEFKKGVKSKTDFSLLSLTDKRKNEYVIQLEKGDAYQGIYQVLHFIASNNRTQNSSPEGS